MTEKGLVSYFRIMTIQNPTQAKYQTSKNITITFLL